MTLGTLSELTYELLWRLISIPPDGVVAIYSRVNGENLETVCQVRQPTIKSLSLLLER